MGTMLIEEAMRRRLSASAGLVAVVSTRIYPLVAAQTATLPYLVYTRIDGDPDHHMSAESGFATMRMQIDAYAASYTAVKALANLVRLALNGYQGTVTAGENSVNIGSIRLENDQDIAPLLSDGEDVPRYYRVTQDYIVTHSQEVPTF